MRVARVLSLIVALVASGVMAGTVGAAPAAAARCDTQAHVYVQGGHVKTEFDPIDGPVDDVFVPQAGEIHLGGNGMTPNEYPFWITYRESDLAHVATTIGNKAGNNCVANEKSLIMNLSRGNYIVRTWYYRGNTGGVVEGQKHFRLIVF